MEIRKSNRTNHALDQMTNRDIPDEILDILESFGESRKCRDGGRKLAFGKNSRSLIRKNLGRKALQDLEKYRNIYAVECNGRIVTVARSRKPLFK